MKKVLIIGKVWPEPKSSAAGLRMMHLIHFFLRQKSEVHFASTAHPTDFSETLTELKIQTHLIELNNVSFDQFVSTLNPTLVLFDRFTSEEQFGWRVAQQCPDAFRLLDTEDLHGLRQAREHALKEKRQLQISDLHSDLCKREVASIYRSDLSLIISKNEIQLLKDIFQVPDYLLFELPMPCHAFNSSHYQQLPAFETRQHFISIGNFLHAPNRDAIFYLKEKIWPLIRKQLPNAELHNYGAYPDEKIFALHDPKNGFLVKGRAENANAVMSTAKICLAPLRFGAGQKGKLLLAMESGTPSITTTLGAEGMHDDLPWPGFITDAPEEIANNAVELYNDANQWELLRQRAPVIANTLFDTKKHESHLENILHQLLLALPEHRLKNFTGSLLQHQSRQSTKYMALWIEEKNKK